MKDSLTCPPAPLPLETVPVVAEGDTAARGGFVPIGVELGLVLGWLLAAGVLVPESVGRGEALAIGEAADSLSSTEFPFEVK